MKSIRTAPISIVILMFRQEGPGSRLIPGEGMRLFLTGGLFGSVGALIAISPIGRISGAHLNPAVTLAFWLEKKLAWRDASLYVMAQFTGSAAGALPLLRWGRMGESVAFGATQPGSGFPIWVAMLGETGVTFLLILAILATAAHPSTRRLTLLVLPAVLSVLVWLEAPISGASDKPGPCVRTCACGKYLYEPMDLHWRALSRSHPVCWLRAP